MAAKSGKTRRGNLGQDGVAAVELAIIIPIFVLFIAGILDFGHAWYLQHAVTTASRVGARYGIVYRNIPGTNTRQNPLNFTPSIETVVNQFLGPPDGPFDQIIWTVAPPRLTLGTGTVIPGAGNVLTVTVSIIKPWYMLGGWFGIDPDVTILGSTTMRLE